MKVATKAQSSGNDFVKQQNLQRAKSFARSKRFKEAVSTACIRERKRQRQCAYQKRYRERLHREAAKKAVTENNRR